jgi:hypothetical protein
MVDLHGKVTIFQNCGRNNNQVFEKSLPTYCFRMINQFKDTLRAQAIYAIKTGDWLMGESPFQKKWFVIYG